MSDDREDLYRESLTPGSRDSRFYEPDPEFDYEGAAEHWTNDQIQAEARLDAIESEAVATAKTDEGTVETRLKPLLEGDEGNLPKRLLFSPPENDDEVDALVRAIAEGNEFVVVRLIVDEPDIYRKRWDRQLRPIERGILFDLAYSFIRADELVDPRLIAELGRNG